MRAPILPSAACAFALVAGVPAAARPAVDDREPPIAVAVGDHPDRHRGFWDSLDSENLSASERDIERALRSRPWLDVVDGDAEVTLEVTRRSVGESSRSKPKEGKVTISWRYVVRAAVRARSEHDSLEASTTSSETLSESEAFRTRRETWKDGSTFERLGRELAEKADEWILERLDLLRPRRPDAGFRHQVKHKWLLAGDGLEVTEVLPGSPAAVAGLEVGDRIRAVDSEKGTAEMDRRARTWWFDQPGRRVRLEVERGKARRTIECTVERPRRWPGSAAPDGSVQER